MGQNTMHKQQEKQSKGRPLNGRLASIAGIVILLAAVVWIGAVLGTRGATSSAAALKSLVPGGIVAQADGLPSATAGQEPYAVWTASTEQDGTTATLYTAVIPSPLHASVASRLLLMPQSLTVGVIVDPSMAILQVRVLSPRRVVGAPGTLASFLDGYTGMSFFQVLTAADGYAPAGGGALTEPVGTMIKDLAASAYLRDMGPEGFDRFISQVNSPGLTLDFPFPTFAATTWDGTPFDLGQLAGRKVLVLFTQPTCGSCLQATMNLLNTVEVRKFDLAPVVFIFGDRELEPVKRFAEDAPAAAILISDPDSDLARTVHQTLAPYAVILDEQHIIKYSGASDENSGVYQYLEQLAGAQ